MTGLRLSPRVFAVAYCIAYAIVFAVDWPLFSYYPVPKVFTWGWQPLAGAGPVMAWYGLMASAAIIALLASLIVPDKVVDRTMPNYVWVFPVGAMLVAVFLMRRFFIY